MDRPTSSWSPSASPLHITGRFHIGQAGLPHAVSGFGRLTIRPDGTWCVEMQIEGETVTVSGDATESAPSALRRIHQARIQAAYPGMSH